MAVFYRTSKKKLKRKARNLYAGYIGKKAVKSDCARPDSLKINELTVYINLYYIMGVYPVYCRILKKGRCGYLLYGRFARLTGCFVRRKPAFYDRAGIRRPVFYQERLNQRVLMLRIRCSKTSFGTSDLFLIFVL